MRLKITLNMMRRLKRIGIGRATYFRWLKGESTHLKANTLKKLSDMLDCDVKKYFG